MQEIMQAACKSSREIMSFHKNINVFSIFWLNFIKGQEEWNF